MERPCARCKSNVVLSCSECLEYATAILRQFNQQMVPPLGGVNPEEVKLYKKPRWQKRTPVERACEYCRQSKTRCEKSRPCARCVRAGRICTEQKDQADDCLASTTGKADAEVKQEDEFTFLSACLSEGDAFWTKKETSNPQPLWMETSSEDDPISVDMAMTLNPSEPSESDELWGQTEETPICEARESLFSMLANSISDMDEARAGSNARIEAST